MHISSLVVTKLAAIALVLTVLVFAPISSQAVEVLTDGSNTATGINDLECGEGVFYDVTFVFDVGTEVYGPHPGEFPYEGANDELATFGLGDCIQTALNASSEAITRVGPENRSYFFIAFGAETEEPGTETPWFYGAFESRYYDTVNEEINRPAETWVPADNFMLSIEWFPTDDEFNFVDITWEGFPFGVRVLPDDVPYSWAKVEPAAESPAPDEVTIGGTVTGLDLEGSGLVLQNNGADDEPIAADGAFTFDTLVPAGSGYAVTVKTQPSNPAQKCTVARGSGTAPAGGVDDVLVTCTDPPVVVPPVSDEVPWPAVYFALGIP